ncbi:MAG: hypothetical protein A3G39_05115 [Deltaproteobacteria bacterium RIFCSPLOWO2_12_FULL_43_16]|nr:MAG: hypothetical protein A2Z89_04150 [Deltaproteobacteria bacterium GWA2_43_19]OGQ09372.1 MAG: hypothetical protein A3D30_00995 [Deltaproteobacteria bacterium RIFCSPHIGHO2_02_FULL_43_33]OGQ44084.1 MAG: hypothetical protein A3A85_06165 [Deltaproteobacteria bacterium RIFCSPLOWO2_01_FULL_42_9]OGQ58601.1 MAG: hypothetical protein A3G39_05115 [Deltaproteobacteria bacterium RIFCSPLOWO2_12_FULL_43_16]HBR18322.1 hypothetical protein [Deltaproteobacteria bacterium]
MKNQLLLLEKVQAIDIQIGIIEEEEKQYNTDIARLLEEIKEHETKIATLKVELDELEKLMQTLDDEIFSCTERIKKNEDRLKNIKNDKEFNAATKELNTAKKEKQTKEGERSKLIEKVDEKKGLIKEADDRLQNKKTELEGKNTAIITNKEEWGKGLKEKTEEKAAIIKDIPPSLLKRYETIKQKRQGIAIVSVEDGTCQGCYMNIPPQAYIQLQKGSSDLIFCPHCHRILYWHSKVSNS